MGFFDKLVKSKGGYIFLSHSHNDIEKVRRIRNALESNGFEPLCFYLKCLDDDSEIEDLIKREIDAREWFVFVNSENSRSSKWVTLEREYITKTDKKKIITVDIDDDEAVENAVYKIVHNLRIFISYAAADSKLARRIKEKLEEKDYLVFFPPDSIPWGVPYSSIISNAIYEASSDGCVLMLITPDSVKSEHVLNELYLAFKNYGNIISIVVGDVELSDEFKFCLSRNQSYRLSQCPTDEELDVMVDMIGQAISK